MIHWSGGTATTKIPRGICNELSCIQETIGMVSFDEGCAMMTAFVWMDCDCQYFITNTTGLMEGWLYTQYQW